MITGFEQKVTYTVGVNASNKDEAQAKLKAIFEAMKAVIEKDFPIGIVSVSEIESLAR